MPPVDSLPPWSLVVAVFLVAFLYSSVGFGGASGYLAAMSLFALPPAFISTTALLLNVLVASIAFLAYWRAGHLSWGLLLPFLVTSVPGAFLGGYLQVEEPIYRTLLHLALGYVGLRLLLSWGTAPGLGSRADAPLAGLAASGLVIGLLSGILGLGGGIFLSPLIVLTGWGTAQQAAASAAAFIVINSLSGLAGRWLGGNFLFGVWGWSLLPVGVVGALLGSRLGARRLSGPFLRRLLGSVLLLAALRYFLELAGWL